MNTKTVNRKLSYMLNDNEEISQQRKQFRYFCGL